MTGCCWSGLVLLLGIVGGATSDRPYGCGNPLYKDTWTVSIQLQDDGVNAPPLCNAVLIDDRLLLLSSQKCRNSLLTNSVARFSSLEQVAIKPEPPIFVTSDLFLLMLAARVNLTTVRPICLKETEGQVLFPQETCADDPTRICPKLGCFNEPQQQIDGRPLVSELPDGTYFLRGIKDDVSSSSSSSVGGCQHRYVSVSNEIVQKIALALENFRKSIPSSTTTEEAGIQFPFEGTIATTPPAAVEAADDDNASEDEMVLLLRKWLTEGCPPPSAAEVASGSNCRAIPNGVCAAVRVERGEGGGGGGRCVCNRGFRFVRSDGGEKSCVQRDEEVVIEEGRPTFSGEGGGVEEGPQLSIGRKSQQRPKKRSAKLGPRSDDPLLTSRNLREPLTCGTISGEACQFPYVVNGVTRYECAEARKLQLDNSSKPFCPTRLDKSRKPLQFGECSLDSGCPLMKYHTHPELETELQRLVQSHPDDAGIFSVGRSRGGANLVGIRISRGVSSPETEKAGRRGPRLAAARGDNFQLRPRVKLIGNMHGNEPVGRELLIHFAKYLLEADERGDARAGKILDSTDLYILPTMNPDGFARANEGECSGGSYAAGRLNEGKKDLNRDFPDFDDWRRVRENPSYDIFKGRQEETKLLMEWILRGHFVLSANFHDGAVLVNYPWDNYHDSAAVDGVFKTPDHPEFYHLATSYSLSHLTMKNTTAACKQWGHFEDGVTNGADWYSVVGGMQDFNYLFAGTMEVTVEISCCKYPHKSRLLREWDNNKESLFNFVEQAQRGIKGTVSVDGGKVATDARVRVRGPGEPDWRQSTVSTDENGAYWRILMPGTYEVQAFSASNEKLVSKVETVRVADEERPRLVDLVLQSAGAPAG